MKKTNTITNLKCKLQAHILKSFRILTHALALRSASCKQGEDNSAISRGVKFKRALIDLNIAEWLDPPMPIVCGSNYVVMNKQKIFQMANFS